MQKRKKAYINFALCFSLFIYSFQSNLGSIRTNPDLHPSPIKKTLKSLWVFKNHLYFLWFWVFEVFSDFLILSKTLSVDIDVIDSSSLLI